MKLKKTKLTSTWSEVKKRYFFASKPMESQQEIMTATQFSQQNSIFAEEFLGKLKITSIKLLSVNFSGATKIGVGFVGDESGAF